VKYRIACFSIGELVKISTVLYALLGVLFVPFYLVMSAVNPEARTGIAFISAVGVRFNDEIDDCNGDRGNFSARRWVCEACRRQDRTTRERDTACGRCAGIRGNT